MHTQLPDCFVSPLAVITHGNARDSLSNPKSLSTNCFVYNIYPLSPTNIRSIQSQVRDRYTNTHSLVHIFSVITNRNIFQKFGIIYIYIYITQLAYNRITLLIPKMRIVCPNFGITRVTFIINYYGCSRFCVA